MRSPGYTLQKSPLVLQVTVGVIASNQIMSPHHYSITHVWSNWAGDDDEKHMTTNGIERVVRVLVIVYDGRAICDAKGYVRATTEGFSKERAQTELGVINCSRRRTSHLVCHRHLAELALSTSSIEVRY